MSAPPSDAAVAVPSPDVVPPDIVLILGMHRSGTSAVTRALSLLGARLPSDLMPAAEDNATGFWESVAVQQLNDRILTALGSRWDDWRAISLSTLSTAQYAAFVDEIAALLDANRGAAPLVLKDPRMCRLLPIWRAAFEKLGLTVACVLALRDPWAVAASLNRRNGLAMEYSQLLWLRHMLDAEAASRDVPRAVVNYDAMLTDWRAALHPALAVLGLTPDEACAQQIDAFLDNGLRHHGNAPANHTLLPWVTTAGSALQALTLPESVAALDVLAQTLDRLTPQGAALLGCTPGVAHPIAKSNGMLLAQLPADGLATQSLYMTPAVAAQARKVVDDAAAESLPRFSIIMPTWNRAATLMTAVDSVLAQSYPHWELIVCDDGSTDDSAAQFSARHADAMARGQVRYLQLPHAGPSAARNAGLAVAQGDWMAYLDSDNTWHADYLLMVAATALRHPARACTYAAQLVHDRARNQDYIRWLAFDWGRLLIGNTIDINIFAHTRALWTQCGGFDEHLPRVEDWDLILRYTREHPPQPIPFVLSDYYLAPTLNNLSLTRPQANAEMVVRLKMALDYRPPAQAPFAEDAATWQYTLQTAWQFAQKANASERREIVEKLRQERAEQAQHHAQERERLEQRIKALKAQADALGAQVTQKQTALQAEQQHNKALDAQANTLRRQVKQAQAEIKAGQQQVTALLAERASSRQRTLKILHAQRSHAQACVPPLGRLALPPRTLLGQTLSPRAQLTLRKQARALMTSGLFDPVWYLQTAPDVARSGIHPVWHWLLRGWQEKRQPNALFDTGWYLRRYADVARAKADPLLHYLHHGAGEGRDPCPLFSTHWYLEQNPDVATAKVNPLGHYLQFGQHEGRWPCAWFAPQWYLQHNADVAAAGIPPLEHYLLAGGFEGRDPCPAFDSDWYLQTYPDIARAGRHPLLHFVMHGQAEGRKPAPNQPVTARVADVPITDRTLSLSSPRAREMQVTEAHTQHAQAQLKRRPCGLFSVVMPSWNRAQTLAAAVDSVLAQTHTNWELLICDDGSTDDTEAMLAQRYAAQMASGKIRYLKLPHGGVCAARNAGLAAARGEWIAYLDSDNTWRPEYLLMMAAALSAEPQRRTAYAGLHVHDQAGEREFIRCRSFDYGELLARNYIDLNVFVHHRAVYAQLGGFDDALRRLVDWDLILRYTHLQPALWVPYVLCDYYIGAALNNITLTEPLSDNEIRVRRKHATTVISSGAEPLRLAYVLWDWPALSQTFVLEELHELRRRNVDVRVYYAIAPDRAATELPDVVATQVADVVELTRALQADRRNWMHSHFAIPAVRKLVWPAAEQLGIGFSFMPHAIDIFPRRTHGTNQIDQVAQSPLCARVMVHGAYHRQFLIERGVPAEKIIMTPQAVNVTDIRVPEVTARARKPGTPLRVLAIARFVEKKGLEYLIEAAAHLPAGSVDIQIYGYGSREEAYRAQIKTLGVADRVHLLGAFEGTEPLRAALAQADVFCLPCVHAEDGDTDGMPTVFFEAMAAGVPCVGTTVAAIPDFITHGINGFLVPPRDAQALAAMLTQIAQMPAAALAGIARAAHRGVDAHLGAAHTVDTLLDVCAKPPLDLFMVTYHRDRYGEWDATERAIRSVLDRTTTPMMLTIVDNASEPAFLQRLHALAQGDARVRIVELADNRLCGPASNVALELARSEQVFYVCSNEGYVTRTGWERPCLRHMRNHPDVAIGGHLVASPAWTDGAGYLKQPWFSDFRNPEFAQQHPQREFFHVQGGFYVLRRSVFQQDGGFSTRRPQAQTDVEYCYYLESKGHKLGSIPEMVVLSNKTRPGLDALIDETTTAVHPVFTHNVAQIDASTGAVEAVTSRCNLCNWSGDAVRDADAVSFTCPQCASSARDRAVYRWLAASNLHHRGKTLDGRGLGKAAQQTLAGMFTLVDGDDADVRVADMPEPRPSRMLGIAPASG